MEHTQAALCSKDIKKLLKGKYPSIKFSVTSSNFAGGNSVDVDWNLGPTTDEIEKLISQYQYGHFDGMIDMYEYSNTRKDIPQAKFVMTRREFKNDEEFANNKLKWKDPLYRDLWKEEKTLWHIMMKDLCVAIGIEYQGQYTKVFPEGTDQNHLDINSLLHRILARSPLMTGYHGIKRTDVTCGLTEEFYTAF